MARLGAFCFPGTGHINPMTALARTLAERGHQVVLFGIADIEARVRAAGVEFHLIGESDYPPGTLRTLDQRLSELTGLATLRFTVGRIKNTARMILRDGPEAVRVARVEALLVDETDVAGSIAEHVGLPFVSIAFFPPLQQSDRIPPFVFGWGGGQDRLSRLRNRIGNHVFLLLAAPTAMVANEQRKEWGLKPLGNVTGSLSRLAQITQLPLCLEFVTTARLEHLHYTGPFVDARVRPAVEFPWDRLDNRPLVYASLGTLQNGSEAIFKTIAQACDGLGVQLVLSLGGGLEPERLGELPGDPIVVGYAPQLEMVKRAALVITHAGLNTVLESLAAGVPLVALPQGNDQPGVAARVAASGAGLVVTSRRLNVARLREAVRRVLVEEKFRAAAKALETSIGEIDGLGRAADIVEDAFGLRAGKAFAESRSL
jgi:zeaxanthin glucosyltransferase